MDYYAAFLREPGEKLNNDGLMIKGFRTGKAKDVVIMVLSTDKRNGRLSDKVVRAAEKIVNKKAEKSRPQLKKLFNKYSKRGFLKWRNTTDLTIIILMGINYYVLNSGKNRVMRVGRLGTEDITTEIGRDIIAMVEKDISGCIEKDVSAGIEKDIVRKIPAWIGKKCIKVQESYCLEGRLSEGSTLIAGNEAFFERQLGSDIHKRLCPQMCTCQEAMQNNMDYLSELLWSRGEDRPVTAAAVCVR